MRKDTLIKIIILNAAIALANILLFSSALIHVDISGGNAVSTAFGLTVILMSVIVFIYGNYNLLYQKEVLLRQEDIKTLDNCLTAISQVRGKQIFAGNLETVAGQIRRFKKKEETIKDILLQKFSDTEMSYSSFQGTIMELEQVMGLNIKSMLNRINAFDDDEYEEINRRSPDPNLRSQSVLAKLEIFHEYIAFVEHAVEDNEQIILKLDKLLLEISKFNSIEIGEIENMSAMKEIDELISNAKWYK